MSFQPRFQLSLGMGVPWGARYEMVWGSVKAQPIPRYAGREDRHDRHIERHLSHVSLVCYHAVMDLKSKREAAELLGVSTRGVERAVRRGHLSVLYRDSKHGKKAWFSPQDLHRYKQHQETRGSVGFTSGIPGQPPGPTVGTIVPMVEMAPWPKKGRQPPANPVPIADRLTLTLNDAVQLSGLPRSVVNESIHSGKLKAIKLGRTYYVKRSDLNDFVQNL